MSKEFGRESGRSDAYTQHSHSQGGGRLLHLADYGSLQPERILHEIRSYWENLRNGRAIPCRADIDPRGMRRALDQAFILERIAPGAARFRLAGRHLIDLMGAEVRGMPICSFVNTSSRGRLSDVLESVFRGPQIAEIALSSPAAYGRPVLAGKLLLLPLRSDLGDVTRALGCLVADGTIGMAPRRFDLVGDAVFPVIRGAQVLAPSPSNNADITPTLPAVKHMEVPSPEERRARFRIISNEPEVWTPPRRM